jgi:hypothetical protein
MVPKYEVGSNAADLPFPRYTTQKYIVTALHVRAIERKKNKEERESEMGILAGN